MRRSGWRALLASLTLAVTACSGSGAPEPEAQPSAQPQASSTAPSASASPSAPGAALPEGDLAVAEVADTRALVATTPGSATVDIDTGVFSLDGTATFGDAGSAGASLIGTMDFRQSDDDGSYVARGGLVRVEVPGDVDFPSSGTAPPGNPWGGPMARVDPNVVSSLVRRFGESAFARRWSTGVEIVVRLRGEETLVALGYEPVSAVPDQVDYRIGLDEAGRLDGIESDLGRFGVVSAGLSDWSDGPGAAT